MAMPNLKRINIASVLELDTWLAKNSSNHESVMLVTHTNASHKKFVSRESVAEALAKHNWNADSRYTLSSDLLGHVITKSV